MVAAMTGSLYISGHRVQRVKQPANQHKYMYRLAISTTSTCVLSAISKTPDIHKIVITSFDWLKNLHCSHICSQ